MGISGNQHVDSNSCLAMDIIDLCCCCILYGVESIYCFNFTALVQEIKWEVLTLFVILFEDGYTPFFDIMHALSTVSDFADSLYATYLSEYVNMCVLALPTIDGNHPIFQMYTWRPGLVMSNLTAYYAFVNYMPGLETHGVCYEYCSHIFVVGETYGIVMMNVFVTFLVFGPLLLLLICLVNYVIDGHDGEKTSDQEFLASQSNVLVEEELGAYEDKVVYKFYFITTLSVLYAYAVFSSINIVPLNMAAAWMYPSIGWFIMGLPYSIIHNFGVHFFAYLRGAAVSGSFASECLYDFIVAVALVVRFGVQCVRLLLIFFLYALFHDFFIFNRWEHDMTYGHESFMRDLYAIEITPLSIANFFFLRIPYWVWYLIFETAHTFFVMTAQYFSFFAMIFWLFFFLYTCFTFDPQEEYIKYMRNIEHVKVFLFGNTNKN